MDIQDQQLSRNPAFMASEIDNEYVLMCLQSGKYYFIKHAGTRIWELLEQPMDLASLVHQLQSEYQIEAKQCRQDVQPFIKKLIDKGLILSH